MIINVTAEHIKQGQALWLEDNKNFESSTQRGSICPVALAMRESPGLTNPLVQATLIRYNRGSVLYEGMPSIGLVNAIHAFDNSYYNEQPIMKPGSYPLTAKRVAP